MKLSKKIPIILAVLVLLVASSSVMAGEHGKLNAHGPGQGERHGEAVQRVEVKAIPVTLADAKTLNILKTDWLRRESQKAHAADNQVGFSGLFWTFLAAVGVMAALALVLIIGGTFKRFGLNMKLYASYGCLVLLAAMLGIGGYLYISRINAEAHLEAGFLELKTMASLVQVAQNEFLLHGIENKAYGEQRVAVIKDLINEFGEDVVALKATGILTAEQIVGLDEIEAEVGKYAEELKAVVKAYHEIEDAKEKLDEEGERVNHALEQMMHHHENELAKLEAQGTNLREITYQTMLVEHLATAEILSLKVAHDEVGFLLDKHPERVGSMEKNMGLLKGYLKALEEELRSDEEKELLREIEARIEDHIGLVKMVIKDEAHIQKYTAEMVELLHQIEAQGGRMSHEAVMIANGMEKEADIAILVLSIIALVAGTLMAILVSRGISRPINRTIEGLNQGADQVASASGQVSASSQQLAEGSSEQAASIEETSSSLEEMSSMIKQNADNAGQADNLMQDAKQVVGLANKSMMELTTSMDEISKASEETSKIIKTIDEIAFQTNLLALNAAVEAARAGESGAGFAVVADEVRNLAMRAADAAKDTAELIEGTVKKVSQGSELVIGTNKAFGKVADSASKVGELVAEIAAASNEQAHGIEQVNTAVTEMDKVAQSNAASAEESASASEEMSAQAEEMKTMVGDLVALVEGNEKWGSLAGPSDMPVVIHPRVAGARVAHSKAKALPTKQSDEVTPQQNIPLVDDDFKDF